MPILKKSNGQNANFLHVKPLVFKGEPYWYQDYSRATFIDWRLPESETYRQYTQSCADYLDWKYDEVTGDKALLQKLVDGIWDDTLFLVVEPGALIAPDVTSSGIIKAVAQ